MPTEQGPPQREREPHRGAEDCKRGRHDWRLVYESPRGNLYVCRCCDEEHED